MANQFSVNVPNVLQALMAGEQGYQTVHGIRQGQEQDAARKMAASYLESGDGRSALAQLVGSNDPKMAEVLAQHQAAANGVYGTPIYGTDPATGKTVLGAIGKSGTFNKLDTGGVQIDPGIKIINTPQGDYVVQGRSGAQIGAGAAPTQPQPGQPPQAQPQAQPGQPQPMAQPGQPPGFYPKDYRNTEADKTLGRDTGEKQAKMGAAQQTLDSSLSNVDRLLDQVKSVAADPALGKITGVQGVFPNWPGGRAANVQARLDNVTSQAGFAVLQAMRDASKTGGALGQVSDFENRQLQNNLSALARSQDDKQYREQLQKIVEWGEGVKQRLKAAYDTDYGGLQRQPQNAQPGAGPVGTQGGQASKSIGGKNYIQINGQWFEQ